MIYLVLLQLLVFLSKVVHSDQNDLIDHQDDDQDHLTTLQKAILIEPNYTGLDCYFNSNEDCYWTWDADNYTEEVDTADHKPGQNGFIRLDSDDVKRYFNKWPGQFFGPYLDPRNFTGKNQFICKSGLRRLHVSLSSFECKVSYVIITTKVVFDV